MSIEEIQAKIQAEMDRQLVKWGIQKHDSLMWISILTEELGEVAKAINEDKLDELRAELIQCAAVICTWLQNGERDHLRNPMPNGTIIEVNDKSRYKVIETWMNTLFAGHGAGAERWYRCEGASDGNSGRSIVFWSGVHWYREIE